MTVLLQVILEMLLFENNEIGNFISFKTCYGDQFLD